MSTEKKALTAPIINELTPLAENVQEDIFPTRDTQNKKIEVTELFSHFTASIIQEDKTFIR